MRPRIFGAALCAVVLSGCAEIMGGDTLEFPDGVKYFDAALFQPLWDDLKACSSLSGNLRSVDFFYVPHVTLPTSLHGIRTVGMYFPKTNRIFIVETEKWNTAVIRHEMMHALLKDESGHPAKYFGSDGLCGYV
jgi:hypothetical protein